ncbi:MAG: GAF domain-containing protein [Bacteroidota bacterium]|nr:GAF domain-containing protein [Bacteroidota bacterium]
MNKSAKYKAVNLQLSGLMDRDVHWIANAANFCSLFADHFDFFWIGFYYKIDPSYLELGPFQGPAACTKIHKGKGVCGHVWQEGKAQIVPNVHRFPGHIACNEESKSEIVLPVFSNKKFWGVLDVDSQYFSYFDNEDLVGLQKALATFEKILS